MLVPKASIPSASARALLHDGEFIAAESRGEPAVLRDRLEPPRDGDQHAIPVGMAHAVVERLEVVDVEEEHADALAGDARPIERLVERAKQLPAVGDARERILLRELLQLARALLDLGFESLLRIARGVARHRELLRHRVEGHGERVELADAAAGHHAGVLAARQAVGGGQQPPYRPHDAEDRREAEIEQHDEHHARSPTPRASGWGPAPWTANADAASGCRLLPASGGASGKRAGNSAASLRDSRAKASTADMRRSSFLKRATRVVVSACTSPVIAWYQSAPGERRSAASRSRSVAARVRSAPASGPVSSSRASNEPRVANVARTASSCARTSSSGSRATTRPRIFQLCSIDVLTRMSMPVSSPEYRVSSSRRTRRACTSASALFLCSATRRGSWLGAATGFVEILAERAFQRDRACA